MLACEPAGLSETRRDAASYVKAGDRKRMKPLLNQLEAWAETHRRAKNQIMDAGGELLRQPSAGSRATGWRRGRQLVTDLGFAGG